MTKNPLNEPLTSLGLDKPAPTTAKKDAAEDAPPRMPARASETARRVVPSQDFSRGYRKL